MLENITITGMDSFEKKSDFFGSLCLLENMGSEKMKNHRKEILYLNIGTNLLEKFLGNCDESVYWKKIITGRVSEPTQIGFQ